MQRTLHFPRAKSTQSIEKEQQTDDNIRIARIGRRVYVIALLS